MLAASLHTLPDSLHSLTSTSLWFDMVGCFVTIFCLWMRFGHSFRVFLLFPVMTGLCHSKYAWWENVKNFVFSIHVTFVNHVHRV